jgi:hypothetical protein
VSPFVLLDRNAHGCGCPPPPQRSPQGGALAALAAIPHAAVVRAALASAMAGVELPRPRYPIRITEAPAPSPAASRPASSTARADVPHGFLLLYQHGARRCPELPWSVLAAVGGQQTPTRVVEPPERREP